jgi:hypothetical protein
MATKAELTAERSKRHALALVIVQRRMNECSMQSERCRHSGDETKMYQLNVAWHWLDSVRRDLEADQK